MEDLDDSSDEQTTAVDWSGNDVIHSDADGGKNRTSLSQSVVVGGDLKQLPDVPDEGILVKTLFAGVCHIPAASTTTTTTSHVDLSHVAGHEVCAKVLSVGAKVPEDCAVRVGDVIVVYPWPGCGQCEICSAGSPQLCEEKRSGEDANQEEENGDEVDGDVTGQAPDGTAGGRVNYRFNSFQVVNDWQHAVRLPREIPPSVGCLLPCSALRAYAALLDARPCFDRAVRVRGFANLLLVGGDSVDGLELWCVLLLKSVFCNRNVKVVCASRRQDRLDLAVKSGADDAVLLPRDASVCQLVDATTMSGYNRMDVAVDLVGDGLTFAVAARSLHRGGTLIELGAWPGCCPEPPVDLPLSELVERSLTLMAVKTGGLTQLRQLVDVLAVQRVAVDVPVEFYRPEELHHAVDSQRRHLASGHAVIKYD